MNGHGGFGSNPHTAGHGGSYGGGGGGPYGYNGVDSCGNGAGGAVRIMWGPLRAYPTTNVADQGTDLGGSLHLDGNDVIRIDGPDYGGSDYKVNSSQAFCFEAWVKLDLNTNGSSAYSNIFSSWESTNSYNGMLLHVKGDGTLFLGWQGSSSTYSSDTTAVVAHNTWTHIAVTRAASSAGKFFVGGTQTGTWSNSDGIATGTNRVYMHMGANMDGGSANHQPIGYISNARIVIGEQVYTTGFTPATEALTTSSQGVTASNTKFLGCQSSKRHTNAVTKTFISNAGGDPAASTESPF